MHFFLLFKDFLCLFFRECLKILTEGFYKKQFIKIYDEHGKGVIINYIVPRPTAYSNNNLGIYVKELWNADMNEMAWAGWEYP